MPNREQLINLLDLLNKHFNTDEMHVLCFAVGAAYDELAGDTKTTKMLALITYLERRGNLHQLVSEVKKKRPKVNWPDISEVSEPNNTPETLPTGDSYIDQKTGLEMIRIPAGEFLYSEDNDEVGTRMRLEYLPEYWISKTPVTNRHYLRFVRATNLDTPKHWDGPSPLKELADHPVAWVSWHEATEYAKWAGMHLPTEQEWEKAARGIDGRKYPWGNEWKENHCNTVELWGGDLSKGSTTQVGQFSPQGDSPFGCVDMAGNVWDWTTSWEGEKTRRIVRGGSWTNAHIHARSANRYHNFPSDRLNRYGFRLVVRPPS